MIPTSEELEGFHDRVQKLDSDLAKYQSKEVTKTELVTSLASLAREWVRISSGLKNGAEGFVPSLDSYDISMGELLVATKARARATSFRAKLKPFREGFIENLVMPVMRFEGSPAQAAARQLEALFNDVVTDDEAQYISEAAKCSSQHCHRAAIILIWAAAIARMHTSIQALGFAAFNAAATASLAKKGPPYTRVTRGLQIGSLPEMQRGRDLDLLVIGMELWGYDLQGFEELDRLLGIRNSSAHPGAFMPLSTDVRSFAEKVKRFVFVLIR
ncbi:MAG: hypothetical protein ACJ8GV_05705 [Luteimonas sp.]